VNSLNRTELWVITLILIAVAMSASSFGAAAAARWGGSRGGESAALGALMNTRGLTELIVLNIALDIGVISTLLFTMLVVMALVTTSWPGCCCG
jgi:Kef-type K+ transport system membrane component KefB